MAPTLLITGFGFLGRHVAIAARKRGWSVTALDRKPDLRLMSELDIVPLVGDIRDSGLMSQIIPEFEYVINTAGILGTSELVDDPAPAVQTNIMGAVNVFQGCRKARICGRVIRCVHVTVGNHFMNNSYAITKSASERFAQMFNTEHATDIRVVRALNAYGAYQKHLPVKKVIPNFVRAALLEEPLHIYGDGSQVMDMIYAPDVARIFLETAACSSVPLVVSAGTGRKTTIHEIAKLVIEATGSRSAIRYLPMRPGEPVGSVVMGEPETLKYIQMSTDALTPFEIGIAETVGWYREHPEWLSISDRANVRPISRTAGIVA